MSILVNKNTRLLVQGITGKEGSYHAERSAEYGANLVAGVTPGKGGQVFMDKVNVYDTVQKAVDAGIEVIACITEGIPVQDSIKVVHYIRDKDVTLIGPNCPGIISPGENFKMGIMPGHIHTAGKTGVVSRSGTLTYEAVGQLTELGIGQSTCVGIGGDPVSGVTFVDILEKFQNDPETDSVVMIGEIGGSAEEEAAEFIKNHMSKPVSSYIAGVTAPPGKKMGHAGAIVSGGKGTAAAKMEALEDAGVRVGQNPTEAGELMAEIVAAL